MPSTISTNVIPANTAATTSNGWLERVVFGRYFQPTNIAATPIGTLMKNR